VQAVLRDRRFRSPAGLTLELQGITSGSLWDRVITGILSLDGDDHTRLRRLVGQAFTPRSADVLRASMVSILDDLVDAVAPAGSCDVVADLARPYPIAVICELLGTPAEDWPLFSAWADDAFKIFNFNVAEDGPAIERAFDELDAYLEELIAARRVAPRDDLLSALLAAEEEGDRLTHPELVMMADAVLLAGTDTTRNQLAAAVQVFCDYPEQWSELVSHPELAPQAVEEVMRFSPVIFGTARIASEDIEIDGVTIAAGTFVDVNTASANRDPAMFPDPDVFDLHREGPPPMLTFGGGIHYCLGVHLARAELAEALVLLARRMPDLRQAGSAPWKPVSGISGPLTLPVTFSPG
jgi:cytochrome P450